MQSAAPTTARCALRVRARLALARRTRRPRFTLPARPSSASGSTASVGDSGAFGVACVEGGSLRSVREL